MSTLRKANRESVHPGDEREEREGAQFGAPREESGGRKNQGSDEVGEREQRRDGGSPIFNVERRKNSEKEQSGRCRENSGRANSGTAGFPLNDGKNERGSEGEECCREELLKKSEAFRHLPALEVSTRERHDEPEGKDDGAPHAEKPREEEPGPGEHEGSRALSRLPGLTDDDEKKPQKKAAR